MWLKAEDVSSAKFRQLIQDYIRELEANAPELVTCISVAERLQDIGVKSYE